MKQLIQNIQTMKEQNIQITTFQRGMAIFRPTPSVLNQAIKFLGEFQRQQKANGQSLQNFAQISIFVAAISEQIRDTKGKRINFLGLLMSRLIGNSKIPLTSLLSKLVLFVENISIDQRYRMQIFEYVQKIEKSLWEMETLLNFIGIMDFELIEEIRNTNYKQIYIELGWLIYIDCKNNHFEEETLDHQSELCLMASVCYFLIRYSLDYAYPTALKNNRNCDKRAIINKILQLLLDLFEIQNIDAYKQIANKFDQYAEQLINNRTFRALSSQIDFFSPYIIYFNYKQLQNRYQKQLKPQNIDYRLIRRQRSITPINKEALLFRLQIKRYENLSSSKKKVYQSHKLLSFKENQMDQSNKEEVEKQEKSTPLVIFDGMEEKSLDTILPSLNIFPRAMNIEVYNYLKNLLMNKEIKIRKINDLQKIKQMVACVSPNQIQNSQLICVTALSINEILIKEIKDQQCCTGIMKDCALAISIFIVMQLFRENSSQIIVKCLNSVTNQSLIKLWNYLQFFIKSQKKIPLSLKKELSNEAQQIICQIIWSNTYYLDQLAQLAANYHKDNNFVAFSTAVILYCQDFISNMAYELQISSHHSNSAYNCLKFILSANGNILLGRHIDQILICSIYIAGKTIGEPVLFAQIKEAYEILWGNNQNKYQKIFSQFKILQNQTGNIVEFYNKRFIQNIEPFIPYMSHPSLNLLHPLFQRKIKAKEPSIQLQPLETNQMNLLETRKPKPPLSNPSKKQEILKNQKIACNINRNQTRVRVRPQNMNENQLCETQRIKVYQFEDKNN